MATTLPLPKLLLKDAWPLLQERFAAVTDVRTGQMLLFSSKEQTAIDRQVGAAAASERSAAVLVLLVSVEGQPSLLFTRRSAHLSQHAAEISFPGGHYEANVDATLTDTAIREAVEELYGTRGNELEDRRRLGDFRDSLRVLGQASPLPSIRGVPVTPIVAALLDRDLPLPVTDVYPGDRSEVDLVFAVSLHELVECETIHTLPKSRFGFVSDTAPVFPTPNGEIWGLTAYILRPVLHQLLKPVFFPDAN